MQKRDQAVQSAADLRVYSLDHEQKDDREIF